MTAHVHAANMALYAQDAAETDRPWERWDYKVPRIINDFRTCQSHPNWLADCEYRRKPRTIRIGEFDVPEPLREAPAVVSEYWAVNFFFTDTFVTNFDWNSDEIDARLLRAGVVHLTKEAAELHAKALISLSAKP